MFCGAAGSCSSSRGAQKAAAERPPAQPFKLKSSSCLPPAWGPRSPHRFAHLLPAQGASSVPPSPTGPGSHGGVWGMVGDVVHQAGAPGAGRDANHPQQGSEGSGRGRVHRVGPRECRGRPDGAQESGAKLASSAGCLTEGRESNRAPRPLAPEQREGGLVSMHMRASVFNCVPQIMNFSAA